MRAMSSKKLLAVCLLTVQLSTSSTVFAKGGTLAGGGGDAVINKDTGAVISIADPMAKLMDQGKRTNIPQSVRDELAKIKRIAEGYLLATATFDTLISESNVDYRLIDEIPNVEICQERIKYSSTDTDVQITQAACTSGNKTWLKKSIYEDLLKRSSKRELALLLVHEGLRRVPNITNEDLVSITNGLRVALTEYDKQLAGEFEQIEENKKVALSSMLESVLVNQLGKEKLSMSSIKYMLGNIEVSDYGGIVYKQANVDENSKVGVGAIVGMYTNVSPNVTILGTIIEGGMNFDNCDFKHFVDSCVVRLQIPQNVKLIDSRIDLSSRANLFSENTVIESSNVKINEWLGPNTQIKNSTFVAGYVDSGARILNSTVVEIEKAGTNLKIVSSNLNFSKGRLYGLKVGSNFLIENSNVEFAVIGKYVDYFGDIPNNVSMRNMKNVKFIHNNNQNDLLKFGTLGLLSDGSISFPEGMSLDFKGNTLCNKGEADVFLKGESHVKIKSQQDLLKYCSSRVK